MDLDILCDRWFLCRITKNKLEPTKGRLKTSECRNENLRNSCVYYRLTKSLQLILLKYKLLIEIKKI